MIQVWIELQKGLKNVDSNFKHNIFFRYLRFLHVCFGSTVIYVCFKEIWEAPMKLGVFLNIAMHSACITLQCIGIRICNPLLMCFWNSTFFHEMFWLSFFSTKKVDFQKKVFNISCFDINTKIVSSVLNFFFPA